MRNFSDDLYNNMKTYSLQDWKKMVSSEMAFIFTTRTYDFDPKILYRARLNVEDGNKIDFFKYVEKLWAPPSKKVSRIGRCNVIGQSTLYCSTSPTTTLFELKPESGEEITIIDYDILEGIKNLGIVGAEEIKLLGDDYNALFGQHFSECKNDSKTLDNFLSDIFKANHSMQYPVYNLTNAIFQIFTDEPQNEMVPDFIKLPKINGLIYPSIATTKLLGINLALDPEAVKKVFKPIVAHKIKVLHKYDEHSYVMIRTHSTDNINTDGEMTWVKNINAVEEFITDL